MPGFALPQHVARSILILLARLRSHVRGRAPLSSSKSQISSRE